MMGPEQSREYDAEIARMAAGASPGLAGKRRGENFVVEAPVPGLNVPVQPSPGLPPFNEAATCEKCGYATVVTAYQSSGCSTPARCGVRWDGPEHLDRVCQRCHYQWAEAVLP